MTTFTRMQYPLHTNVKKIVSINDLDHYLHTTDFYARANTLELMFEHQSACRNPNKIAMYQRLIEYIQLWEIIHATES